MVSDVCRQSCHANTPEEFFLCHCGKRHNILSTAWPLTIFFQFYGDYADGTISVHNYAIIGSVNGTTETIDGYAYVPDASAPGKLKLHFTTDGAPPFDAAYWILALGPINADGLYDWAIVSDNLASTLFVLARNVAIFESTYETIVLAKCVELGFTGFKAPIAIYQGTDCVYDAALRKAQIAESAAVEKLYKETL